jgi:DNA recombination protein RmuC
MMEIVLLILLALILVLNGALAWHLTRPKKEDNQSALLLQNQLNELTRTLDSKLTDASKTMNESVRMQFSESAKIIKEVTEGLTKLDETNRQVVSFADQLQGLQDILKNPKQRGVLGEYYLQTVLENVMPPGSYQMQYGFPNGEIVDAVVFVKEKIIPIDSKFSLENYNRILEERNPAEREKLEKLFKGDLKNRIDETAKYVRPSDGTMDFAFMFIPSEGIYYDLLINQVGAVKTSTRDLIEYAFTKKVIIVSPTSFLAYLQTVLQGLRSLQIEESAKEIRKRVEDLGRHLLNYEDYHNKLGKSLETTVNHFNSSRKELGKIDKDVLRITGEAVDIPLLVVDKPESE